MLRNKFWRLGVFHDVQCLLMVGGNVVLFSSIVSYSQLRRKELLIIAGLAFGDILYGVGFFAAGIDRLSLALQGQHKSLVSPWLCMKQFYTPFFVAGSQIAAFMLVAVSFDRLVAVRWFQIYIGLTYKYARNILIGVYTYVIVTVPIVYLMSYFLTERNPTVIAICISTQVGPHWYASYQPTVQMSCGVLSVVIYFFTYYFYIKQMHNLHLTGGAHQNQIDRQRKLTRTVGITVLFTFFCYVLPHGMIFIFNTFNYGKTIAGLMSPYGWVTSNVNSIVNIFIIGIHMKDVRKVLKAWMHCSKPKFNLQGAALTVNYVKTGGNSAPLPKKFRGTYKKSKVRPYLHKGTNGEIGLASGTGHGSGHASGPESSGIAYRKTF